MDNGFIMLLPRAGLAARVEAFIHYADHNVGYSWELTKVAPDRQVSTKSETLAYVRNLEQQRYNAPWLADDQPTFPRFSLCSQGTEDDQPISLSFNLGLYDAFFAPIPQLIAADFGFRGESKVTHKHLNLFARFVELFQPYFGYVDYNGSTMTVQGVIKQASRPIEQRDPEFDTWMLRNKKKREQHWGVYARTVYFGEELTQNYGLDKLLAAPAHHVVELPGPSVLLYSESGFFDTLEHVDDSPSYFEDVSKARAILYEYDDTLKDYLNVTWS